MAAGMTKEVGLVPLALGVLLVLLSVVRVSGYVCPSPCSCAHDPPTGDQLLVVDCRKQKLTVLPPLDGLQGTQVFRLYLDRNLITSIPDYAFYNMTLQGIQLSDNPLVNISGKAFAGVRDLQYLSLRRTLLETPPDTFTAPLEDLQVLDLSNIRTPAFTRLQALGKLPALEQLLLKQNKMAAMAEDALAGVPTLEELRLEDNALEEVPRALRTLPALRSVHLDNNPITRVDADALEGIKHLETLTLTDTRLASGDLLAANLLEDVRHTLQRLDLGVNNLGVAPCHLLANLSSLRELRLADAMMSEVAPGCFKGLTSLRLLDLSGNKVKVVPATLEGVEASLEVLLLERLDLTLETLPLEALRKLHVLKELSLSGNTLPVLPDRVFAGLAMRKLSLSYCQVTTIDPLTFDGLKAPFTLDLNNNQLRNITFMENKCQFDSIELYRNPVHCDCSFYHVARYGITSFVGQCASPAQYAGVKLNDFQSHPNATSECGTVSGVNDTILCFWQYLTGDDGGTSGGQHTALSSSLLLLTSMGLYWGAAH